MMTLALLQNVVIKTKSVGDGEEYGCGGRLVDPAASPIRAWCRPATYKGLYAAGAGQRRIYY